MTGEFSRRGAAANPWLVSWSAAILVAAAVVDASPNDRDRPRLAVGALNHDVRLDGRLDEAAWGSAPAIEGLGMVEPRQGDTPTQKTVVKVLASATELTFGIRCLDSDPAGAVSFTKERDGDLENEDHVILVLDPFLDGRSGYVFAVNPGGARLDALVQPGGEDVDTDWDGEWEAATLRDTEGWTAEIRIPIHTLRFKRDLREWGFNVQRRIQRLQEIDRWASPRQDFEVFQTSRAGFLTGLPRFDLGRGLGLRPSLVGGFKNASPDAATEGRFEPSLDVTQRLGSNAIASVTVNTDFAETEVDARRINLTRFPLFFPEKRTFFLEAADIFSFGVGIDEESLVPFFGRRIGLVEGQEVPIGAGVKATGGFGQTRFGGLVVRTRDAAGIAPAGTMGALRVKQNLFGESRAGVLATFGDPLGRTGSFEIGGDFVYQTSRFRGDKNFVAGVWGLVVGRDGLEGSTERTAFGLKLDYPNDLWDCVAIYRRIGDGFDPSLGFAPRRGINTYRGGCTYAPRSQGGFLRQAFYRAYPTVTTGLDGDWESYDVQLTPLEWQLESGERLELTFTPAGERLREPFEIADGVAIAPGSYGWWRYRAAVDTAAKRRLSTGVAWTQGAFYSGRLRQLEAKASWTPSPLVTLLAEVEHDEGRFAEGSFNSTLVGTRVRLNLSSNLQLNSFLQYDTEDETFGTNTRLRWTFHPRGDLFVIYNHNLRRVDSRFERDSNELLLKVQYTFRR